MELRDAVSVIRLLSTKGVGNASARRVLRKAQAADLSMGELYERKETNLLSGLLSKDQISDFFYGAHAVDGQIEDLKKQKIYFSGITDKNYPICLNNTLKDDAPILLTMRGNADLLASTTVGFCGSRKASRKGLETAEDCADQLAKLQLVVTSGYANGVDLAAHTSALKSGGSTIIVLPEGMLKFRFRPEIRDLWDWKRILVISQFLPGVPWRARQAMVRNKTIIGLSHVMVVIESGQTGGTMEAGRSALELRRPLYAAMYEDMPKSAIGNRQLLNMGAKPLMKSKSSGRASLDRLVNEAREQCQLGCQAQEQFNLAISGQ
jgi:DNA processing protein